MYVSIYIHAGASDAADIHKNEVDIDVYADVYVRVHNTHVDVYLGCTFVYCLPLHSVLVASRHAAELSAERA